jgi:hypothetical protein
MKRLVLPVLAAALVLSACASSHPVVTIGGPRIPRITRVVPPSPTSLRFSRAANREFARHDAQTLLRTVVLPRSARQVAEVPKSAPSWYRREYSGHFPGAIIVRRIWVVHEPLKQVVRFVRGHARPRPQPLLPYGKPTGRIGSRPTDNYLFHPVPGRSWSRWLNIAMLRLPGGATVVTAQAGDAWIRTPPRSAELPAAVKQIDIRSAYARQRPSVLVHVRNPYEVASIVASVNGLGVAPSIVCATTFVSRFGRGGPTVRLTFRAASGRVIARATAFAAAAGPCSPLSLTVNGKKAPPLIGPDLFRTIEQHLNVDLAPPTPASVAVCLRARGWKVQKVLHGGFSALGVPAPAELRAAHDGHHWLITFHATGKVTTSKPQQTTIARCLRTGPFRLGGFG